MGLDTQHFCDRQEQRIDLFRNEVDDLRKAHGEAMLCQALEDSLEFGIWLYQGLMAAADKVREGILEGTIQFDARYDARVNKLLGCWIDTCTIAENQIRRFTSLKFDVKHAVEFRACLAEAKWILLPANKAFDHPKMDQIRDEAIEAMDSGAVLAD